MTLPKSMQIIRSHFRYLNCLAAAGIIFLCGCTSSSHTHPPRTAIEQLLLSTAVDNSLRGVDIPQVEGERIYVDAELLEAYDRGYVIGSVRALLSENGALLQATPESADMIVEVRSGALGMDVADSLVGIPAIPIIIPGAGTTEFPELVLYSSNKQNSVSKIALLGYRTDGENVFSTEPLVGLSHFNSYKFLLLLQINFTNIPERENF